QAEYRVQAARGTAPARGGGSGPGDVADAAGFGAGGGARMDLADPQAQPGPELDVRAQSVLGAGVVGAERRRSGDVGDQQGRWRVPEGLLDHRHERHVAPAQHGSIDAAAAAGGAGQTDADGDGGATGLLSRPASEGGDELSGSARLLGDA